MASFDQELVLRFFALKNNIKNFKHDVADFLTEYMEAVSDPDSQEPFDYGTEREVFMKTFTILKNTLGDTAFAYANKARDGLTKGFGVYHFEAFTIGLQPCLERIKLGTREEVEELK